jgi:F-type H+-transporting ATPase subunit epsilon
MQSPPVNLSSVDLKAGSLQIEQTEMEIDMEAFNLSILAPERRLIEGERVVSAVLTTTEGEIEILPGHANMVAQLEPGRFTYTPRGGKPVTGVISSGFVNVESGTVKVVAETIELAAEIDVERAKRAHANAEKKLEGTGLDEAAFKKYQLKLQRATIRQSIGTSI